MQQFVTDLLSTGRVRLQSDQEPTADECMAAVDQLLALEESYRADVPGTPPDVVRDAAEWALSAVYRLCQFHVYRHLRPEELESRFRDDSPECSSAAVHYSVDLTLRFLPDVAQLIRTTSPEDPLLGVVLRLAEPWPLSSVGIPDVEVGNVEPILADDCLRRMYVDRIIRSQDKTRCGHPVVQSEFQRVAGAWPDLVAGLETKADEGEPTT